MSATRIGMRAIVTALVLSLVLAGCGDNGDGDDPDGSGVPPSAGEPHLPPFELPAEFRECMADEGIEIPESGVLPADVDPVRFQEALQACGELLHG